eukprot:gene11893-14994_t
MSFNLSASHPLPEHLLPFMQLAVAKTEEEVKSVKIKSVKLIPAGGLASSITSETRSVSYSGVNGSGNSSDSTSDGITALLAGYFQNRLAGYKGYFQNRLPGYKVCDTRAGGRGVVLIGYFQNRLAGFKVCDIRAGGRGVVLKVMMLRRGAQGYFQNRLAGFKVCDIRAVGRGVVLKVMMLRRGAQGYFQNKLAGYKHPLSKDLEIIDDPKTTPRQKIAARLTKIEKGILNACLDELKAVSGDQMPSAEQALAAFKSTGLKLGN